jgi:hypothetical protein
MSAGTANLLCEQGATFERTLTWKDANGTAIDITNYEARMDVRFAATKEADLVISLTFANSRISRVAPNANGKFKLLISATDTTALTPSTYFYDLEVYSSDGSSPQIVQRLLKGKFTVEAEVTG